LILWDWGDPCHGIEKKTHFSLKVFLGGLLFGRGLWFGLDLLDLLLESFERGIETVGVFLFHGKRLPLELPSGLLL
jgi:hypothetical protein